MNISYRIFTDKASWFASFPLATEDLAFLAKIVKPDSPAVTEATLCDFFDGRGVLSVACDGKKVVGAACLARVTKYNGFTYRLEHVSVHPEYQGRGIGRAIIAQLHLHAGEDGRYIDLTCEPARVSANALYESMGYLLRETNVRRFIIKSVAA